MSEFTPGPWHVGYHKNQVRAANGDVIDLADEANARLIAASPQLYEALKLLWAETVASGNSDAKDYGWPKAREAVYAAIAAADGRDVGAKP